MHHNMNAATGVLSCLSAAFTGSAAACQPVAIHILSSLLAAKTSLGDVQSTLYITPEGSSSRELLGSVGLANVIDAGLDMLLGSETSGTAVPVCGARVCATVLSTVSCKFASTPMRPAHIRF